MNRLPIVSLVYNRHKTANVDKKAAIEIRVYYNNKQKYFSTGIYIYPNQWKKESIVNHPDAIVLNDTIYKQVSNIRKILASMVEENNINLNILPYKIKELTENKQSFIEFCNKRAAIRKYGKSYDTQKRYDRFIRLFKEWGRIINFEDVTDKNIISYDEYLTKKGLKVYSKWNNYHRFLNTFILDAISENLLPTNPYKWVNIQKDKGYKGLSKCLSPEEFDKLQRVQVYTKSLERVKDLFIFQTYTCLSYSDLKDFCADRLHNINGMQVYISKRHKTGKTFTIPLMKPALDILYKYNNVLPIISNVKYNAYLKVIAQAAGIDKPISSHWARHTGATLLLNKGIPMQIIAKICGHSSTKITEQVYAKLLDETVVDAIKTLRLSQARGKT